MSKIIVSAHPAGGYFWGGRKWTSAPVELEIVDEPEAEKLSENDDHAAKMAKQDLRHARIASDKVTAREVETIKKDPHLSEFVAPACHHCAKKDAEIASLKAQLEELTAPKGKKAA